MTQLDGHVRIAELVGDGSLDQVPPDATVARRLVDDARRHLVSARAVRGTGDLNGAYQLTYDALRKAATSLLTAQGLRTTARGGHVAVQEAVKAQFGSRVRAFRSYSRVRRTRNSLEYPDSDTAGASEADLDDATDLAQEAIVAAVTVLDRGQLGEWTP